MSSQIRSTGAAISPQNDGEYSEPFPVSRLCTSTDTVQRDVLCYAFSGCDGGFQIRHRFDGKLFSIRRF